MIFKNQEVRKNNSIPIRSFMWIRGFTITTKNIPFCLIVWLWVWLWHLIKRSKVPAHIRSALPFVLMEFRIEEAERFLETRNLFNITYEQKNSLSTKPCFSSCPLLSIRSSDPISHAHLLGKIFCNSALVIVKQPIRVLTHQLLPSVQDHVLVLHPSPVFLKKYHQR